MVTLSRQLGPPAHLVITVQQYDSTLVCSTARGRPPGWGGGLQGTARRGRGAVIALRWRTLPLALLYRLQVRVHIMCCLRRPRVYRGVGQPTSWLVATGWVSPRYTRGRGSSRGHLPGRDGVQIYHRHALPNRWDGATTPVIDPTLE